MNEEVKLSILQSFRGMDSSDAVKAYAEKRALKIAKHIHHQGKCEMTYLQEKNDFLAELHIIAGDFEAKAEGKGETLYAAIDEVTDKVLQQSRKFKEKQADHSGRPHHNN